MSVKNVLIFTVGAGIGVGGTWKYFKEKYSEYAEEEIESVKTTFKNKNKDAVKEKLNNYADDVIDGLKSKTDTKTKPKQGKRINKDPERAAKTVRKNYNEIIHTYNPEVNDLVPFRNEEELNIKDPEEPYIITSKRFVDEHSDFDKITLNYYSVDDVLIDEDGNPIDMVEEVIGSEALVSFGTSGPETDLVYVRNEKYLIDYEVIRNEKSYSVDVLGLRD